MSGRSNWEVQVVETLAQWREQHLYNQQKTTARRLFEDRFQQLARQTFDVAFDCPVDLDAASCVEKALHEAFRILPGLSERACDGQGAWEALVLPEDQLFVWDHLRRILSGQRDVCVFRITTGRGDVHWLSSLARPLWDDTCRRVVHVYGLVKEFAPLSDDAFNNSNTGFDTIFP